MGMKLFAKCLVSDQINRAFQDIFKIKTGTKIPSRCGRRLERDRDIHIAVLTCLTTRGRAKQCQTINPELALKLSFMLRKQGQGVFAVQPSSLIESRNAACGHSDAQPVQAGRTYLRTGGKSVQLPCATSAAMPMLPPRILPWPWASGESSLQPPHAPRA